MSQIAPEPRPIELRFTEVLQSFIEQWPIDPDDRDAASRRVTAEGGVQVARAALRESRASMESVALWAFDRPDLTWEALALCPAWRSLFSDGEKDSGRARLEEARKREDRPERKAKTFGETWVFWIDGRPVGASDYGREDPESPSPTCEMFARAAESFAETGQFGASFYQRRHYRTCETCSTHVSLDEVCGLLDQEAFRRFRVLLSMVHVRPDVRPWWMFVLFAFIAASFEVTVEDWVAARQGIGERNFVKFVQCLTTVEFFALPLAKRASDFFEPAAPLGELLLPAELGYPSEPGVVNTSISAEEWQRVHQAEDEAGWGQKPGTGLFDDERLDHRSFWFVLVEATSFQILSWWKGPNPEILKPAYLPPVASERKPEVEHNPIELAEASLREALGRDIYNNLCAEAFMDAAAAERSYLDSDLRQGQGIIMHLVLAFEHQLTRVVVKPFEEALKRAGAREFPWPIAKPLTKASAALYP